MPLLGGLARRVREEDVSFRTRMLEIASRLPRVVSLARGDPDFHTAPHIVDAAKEAIDNNQHHYTHPAGMPQLRDAIAEKLRLDNNLDYGPGEIIVTAGTQEAIMLCMLGVVDTGEEVLVPSPRYTTYDTTIVLCGGVPVPVPTFERDDFALMPAEIERRITDRSKVLVLVSPNNPTGAVTPPDAIREIASLARRHNLLVISDEIYEKLIFDGREHLSAGSLHEMKERTITVNSFSKAYAMTGWRVGYLAAPEPFVRAMIEVRHSLSISASTPSQFAALAALTGPQDAIFAMREAYEERGKSMMKALDRMGLSYGHPGGAYYIYANISNTGLSAEDFCESLLEEGHVMIFPGTLFGDESDSYIRISLVQPVDVIEEAAERMEQVILKHRQR